MRKPIIVAPPPCPSLHGTFLALVNLSSLLLPENSLSARFSRRCNMVFCQTHVFFNKLNKDFFNRLLRFLRLLLLIWGSERSSLSGVSLVGRNSLKEYYVGIIVMVMAIILRNIMHIMALMST
jgi:hypothetical protein